MGEVQTLDQFREWIRNQCRKDVDPQYGDSMVAEFEKIIRADTVPRAQVQAVADELLEQFKENNQHYADAQDWKTIHVGYYNGTTCGFRDSMAILQNHTGIAPSKD